MSKVITFSRKFPGYHPRAGEPTNFIEKIIKGFEELKHPINEVDELFLDETIYSDLKPKWHTVRSGYRFTQGESFSPRVWSGKPYRSRQVTIAPDVKIQKLWSFKIIPKKKGTVLLLDKKEMAADMVGILAHFDGLSFYDFMKWFKYPDTPFSGQIICWNPEIEY